MAELIAVHQPVKAEGKPCIVFLHGLDGDIYKTWMANPKDENTLWPRWVGEDTGCPVWLLGYGASISRWKADAMAIPRQATAVIERLSNESKLLEGPLILVGHSLGGLIIKTALQHGMHRDVERHNRLARNVKGVVFVGTPHFGSRLATIAAWSHLVRANPQVSDLGLHDADLEALNQYFLKLRTELGFKARVYIETQPMRLPWWLGGRFFPGMTIVSPTSSEAHIPGDVGIPIEADHISICKPKSRNAVIHSSLIAFIDEVKAATTTVAATGNTKKPMASENMEAISPEQKPDNLMHLAFSQFGINLQKDSDVPICTSVYLTTDEPDRLRQQIEQIRMQIQRDSLISKSAKARVRSASLAKLIEDPSTKAVTLSKLSIISFSAYLYYCPGEAFDKFTRDERVQKLFIDPLMHRMSKRGERFEQFHTNVAESAIYLSKAAETVSSVFHRTVQIPRPGAAKYSSLEEIATLIAEVASRHLSDLENAETTHLFESLRTRIRYAENVATGEKHKRDVNPLP